MKRLLLFTILLAGITTSAQTYPKYNNQTGNSKASKTETPKKGMAVKVVHEADIKGMQGPVVISRN